MHGHAPPYTEITARMWQDLQSWWLHDPEERPSCADILEIVASWSKEVSKVFKEQEGIAKAAVLIQTQARGIFARHKVEKKREAAKDTQQPKQQEQAHGKGTPPGKGAAEAIAEEELHSLGIKDAQ